MSFAYCTCLAEVLHSNISMKLYFRILTELYFVQIAEVIASRVYLKVPSDAREVTSHYSNGNAVTDTCC